MSTPVAITLVIAVLALLVIWIVRGEIRNARRHGVRGVMMSVLLWLTPW